MLKTGNFPELLTRFGPPQTINLDPPIGLSTQVMWNRGCMQPVENETKQKTKQNNPPKKPTKNEKRKKQQDVFPTLVFEPRPMFHIICINVSTVSSNRTEIWNHTWLSTSTQTFEFPHTGKSQGILPWVLTVTWHQNVCTNLVYSFLVSGFPEVMVSSLSITIIPKGYFEKLELPMEGSS